MYIDKDFKLNKEQIDMQKKIKEKDDNSFAFNYLNIGWSVVIPILLGVFLGLYIDRLFQTKPIFILVFTLLGTVGAFYNLFKLIKKPNA